MQQFRLHFLVLFLILPITVKAQDPSFSQLYANPFLLNPALAGFSECPRLYLNYRNQNTGIPSIYNTYSVAYDNHIKEWNSGFTLSAINDVQGGGILQQLHINGIYSYSIRVSQKFYMRAGLQISYVQRNLDFNKMIFPDMINTSNGIHIPTNELFINSKKDFIDFSTGFSGFSKMYYFGIAIHHLSSKIKIIDKDAENYLPIKITAHAGIKIPMFKHGLLKEKLTLSPDIVYQRQQNFQQISCGIVLARKLLNLGIWNHLETISKINKITLLMGFVYPKFKIVYSYDISSGKKGKIRIPAHEISFSYNFKCKERTKKIKPIPCPNVELPFNN